MNRKIKTAYFFKLFTLVLIWAMVLPQLALAQGKAFEKETLSPAIHIPLKSFLEGYGQAYTETQKTLDEDYFTPENQEERIKNFQEEIIENVKKYSKNFKQDKKILNAVLKIAGKNYKDIKFPDSPNEYYFHHCLTVALDLSQRQAPIESICAAVLHRFDENKIDILLKEAEISEPITIEIRHLYHKLMYILNFGYADMPFAGGEHDLQNFMNFIIQQCEKEENGEIVPDERVLMLVLSDVLASVRASSEKKRDSLITEIDELWAYLAHRSGLEEMKNELFDQLFKYSFPNEYVELRAGIRKQFGMEYEDLKNYLEKTIKPMIWNKIHTVYGKNQQKITTVKVRVKGLYEIYEKMEKTKKTLENINDILGIRVLCDCEPDSIYGYYDLVQTVLLKPDEESVEQSKKKLQDKEEIHSDSIAKIEEFDDQRKKERKEELPSSGSIGVVYTDLVAKIDGFMYEVQVLTEEFNKREQERPHWIYKLQGKTGQKFDQAERYVVTENFKNDFARIFNALKPWVIVFVLKEEGGEVKEVLPKRMPAGSIVADVAALRGVDLLEPKFSGAKRREWSKANFKPIPGKVDVDYVLESGDMLIIENDAFLRGKLSSIRKKAKTLRAQLLVSLMELKKDINEDSLFSAEASLKQDMHGYGVYTDKGSAFEKFVHDFAWSKGLRNEKELYAVFTHCPTEDLNIGAVVQHAETEGKRIAREVFERLKGRKLDDFALGQLTSQFGFQRQEDFYLQVGVGQISINDLTVKISGVSKIPEGMLNLSINKMYKFTFSWQMKKREQVKVNALVRKIEEFLDQYNLKEEEERIKGPRLNKGKGSKLEVTFFAKTTNLSKIEKFAAELKTIKTEETEIIYEEFLDEKKQLRNWEIRMEFPDTGQDTLSFNQALNDKVNSWSVPSTLVKFDSDSYFDKNGKKILEVIATITTDLDFDDITENIKKMETNKALTETSAGTVYSFQDSFPISEAALIGSAI